MNAFLAWRVAKYVALLLLGAATAGAFSSQPLFHRQRAVYVAGSGGLALTWLAGMGLVQTGGWSLGAPWISGGILCSLVWMQILVWVVEKPERGGLAPALGAWAALAVAIALMVFRPGGGAS